MAVGSVSVPRDAADPAAEDALDTTTDVETPEHVRFRYHVAGPSRRFLAYLVDVLIKAGIILVMSIVAGIAGVAVGDELGNVSDGILLVIIFFLQWFYFVVWEVAWSGRSPGKRALRLRVLSDTGHPLTFGQSILRNLLRAADFLPAVFQFMGSYAVAVAVSCKDSRFRRLGDLVAGTMVVVEERVGVGGPLHIHPPPSPKELASLPQRLPLSGDELESLELFLRREPKLPPARAYELAEMVAGVFGKRIGITRIQDPLRFVKVLYARARGAAAQVAPDERAQGWAPPPGAVPFGTPGWHPGMGHPGMGQPYAGYGHAPPPHGGWAPPPPPGWGGPPAQGPWGPEGPWRGAPPWRR